MFEALTVGRLRPQYAWLEPLVGGRAPGAAVTSCVYMFTVATAILSAHNRLADHNLVMWMIIPDVVLSLIIVGCKFTLLYKSFGAYPTFFLTRYTNFIFVFI